MKIKEVPENKEKLYKIACTGDSPAVKKDGEIVGCVFSRSAGGCSDCIAHDSSNPCIKVISDYLNQEYCEFEKGELVEVSDDTIEWKLRYFACMSEDPKFPYGTLPVCNRDASYTINYVYCRKYGTLGKLEREENNETARNEIRKFLDWLCKMFEDVELHGMWAAKDESGDQEFYTIDEILKEYTSNGNTQEDSKNNG